MVKSQLEFNLNQAASFENPNGLILISGAQTLDHFQLVKLKGAHRNGARCQF